MCVCVDLAHITLNFHSCLFYTSEFGGGHAICRACDSVTAWRIDCRISSPAATEALDSNSYEVGSSRSVGGRPCGISSGVSSTSSSGRIERCCGISSASTKPLGTSIYSVMTSVVLWVSLRGRREKRLYAIPLVCGPGLRLQRGLLQLARYFSTLRVKLQMMAQNFSQYAKCKSSTILPVGKVPEPGVRAWKENMAVINSVVSSSCAQLQDVACTSVQSSASRAVKYQALPVAVVCEWTSSGSNGGVCSRRFTDVPTFSSHVKEHFETSLGSYTCRWSGCDFIARARDYFIEHVLFHPFHSYLKLLGAELQAKFNLPVCQMDEQYMNLVPPLTVPPKCLWDDGKCTDVFEGVGNFYCHVRDHVMLQDALTQPFRCKWRGMVLFIRV